MNRGRAKELASILNAFGEGKIIQYSDDGENWKDCIPCAEIEIKEFRDNLQYRIKPEPKKRPMTWGEVMYIITSPHIRLAYQFQNCDLRVYYDEATIKEIRDNLADFRYAKIDKHGNPIDGWHTFEVEEQL